jgi:hypothetical protein
MRTLRVAIAILPVEGGGEKNIAILSNWVPMKRPV